MRWRRPRDIVITTERLEQYLDKLAEVMDWDAANAHDYVPLFQRLERELEAYRDRDRTVLAAQERLKRSRHQISAQS